MKQLSEPQLGWVAGLFDGEGYIGIRHKGEWHWLQISIGLIDKEVIDFFVANWGASRSITKAGQPVGGRYRSKHDFHIAHFFPPNREVARKFLNDILPYLWLKRRRAQVALKWLDEIAQFDGLRFKQGRASRLLGIEKEWRKRMWQEMENPEAQTEGHIGITRPKLF